MRIPEKGIPHDLLDKAVCIGIIPSEKKGRHRPWRYLWPRGDGLPSRRQRPLGSAFDVYGGGRLTSASSLAAKRRISSCW